MVDKYYSLSKENAGSALNRLVSVTPPNYREVGNTGRKTQVKLRRLSGFKRGLQYCKPLSEY